MPVTRTINGVDLSEDRTLNIEDMGDISTGALSGWYTDYVDQGLGARAVREYSAAEYPVQADLKR